MPQDQEGSSGEEPEPGLRPIPSSFDRFAAVAVLTLFALVWPVLDLLGRNAEFFLARRSPKSEIVILAVVGVILVPALVALVGSVPTLMGARLGVGLVGILTAALAFLYLRELPAPWWLAAAFALVLGGLGGWGFDRFPPVRATGRYLLAAPPLLLGFFLFAMPVGDVLLEPVFTVGNPVPVANPVPVVLVIFDEFPLASIIDPRGELRADRYPNFARLAADGIWFRNAVTVQQQTEHSVPAILTGSNPDESLIPVTGHYPFNLFTALRDRYDLHVYESITQLCPRQLCEGLTGTVSSLARDVSVVAGHVLLPEQLSDDLPEIDRGWGNFGAVVADFDARSEFRTELRVGPRQPVDRILEDIRAGSHDRPELFYLHTLLPHHPWQYLPDGRTYPYVVAANPASFSGGWIEDDWLVAQSLQRHLLQVGYVDTVLGELLDTLEAEGIYEEAVVVVTADHGIAIRPGVDHQRRITDESVGEVAAIPLFVKPPGGGGGQIDDRRALTIDILPTIADVLGARLPGAVEGVSLLGPDPGRIATTTVGPDSEATYGADGSEKLAVAARLEALFPGGDPFALLPAGSPDLIGLAVDPGELEPAAFRVRILELQLYRDVDTSGPVVPARIGGVLVGPAGGEEVLAVSVNGTISAVTRSYHREGRVGFLAMVPPTKFVDGENSIEVFQVLADGTLRATTS